MKILFLLLGLCCLFAGCIRVPRSKDKAEKLLSEILLTYPDLAKTDTVSTSDTTYQVDTARVKTGIDTSIGFIAPHPLVIVREGVRLDIKIDSVLKKVFVNCQCENLIITKNTTIDHSMTIHEKVVNRIRYHYKWWVWLLPFIGGMAFMILVRCFFT